MKPSSPALPLQHPSLLLVLLMPASRTVWVHAAPHDAPQQLMTPLPQPDRQQQQNWDRLPESRFQWRGIRLKGNCLQGI